MSDRPRRGFLGVPHALRELARRELEPLQELLLYDIAADANWEPGPITVRGLTVQLDTGEALVTSRTAGEARGMDRDQVRRALRRYEQLGIVKCRPAAPPPAPRSAPPSAARAAPPPTVVRFLLHREIMWQQSEAAPPPAPIQPVLPPTSEPKKLSPKAPPSAGGASEIDKVISHWIFRMGRPENTDRTDRNRRRAVKRHLKAGKSVEQLCMAIDGCALDPFSMGKNESRRRMDDLAWIFRDSENVEKFIRLAEEDRDAQERARVEEEERRRQAEEFARRRQALRLEVVKDPEREARAEAADLLDAIRLITDQLSPDENTALNRAYMEANSGMLNRLERWKKYIRVASEIAARHGVVPQQRVASP